MYGPMGVAMNGGQVRAHSRDTVGTAGLQIAANRGRHRVHKTPLRKTIQLYHISLQIVLLFIYGTIKVPLFFIFFMNRNAHHNRQTYLTCLNNLEQAVRRQTDVASALSALMDAASQSSLDHNQDVEKLLYILLRSSDVAGQRSRCVQEVCSCLTRPLDGGVVYAAVLSNNMEMLGFILPHTDNLNIDLLLETAAEMNNDDILDELFCRAPQISPDTTVAVLSHLVFNRNEQGVLRYLTPQNAPAVQQSVADAWHNERWSEAQEWLDTVAQKMRLAQALENSSAPRSLSARKL